MTCDNETSPPDAGNVTEGSDPEIAYTIGGLGMSLPNQYTSKTARGAASEMIAAAYLMRHGYHVFRAMSATCPVDLIAWKDGENLRVEVKSMALGFPSFTWPRNDDWDLLLVVEPEGVVHEIRSDTPRLEATNAVRAACGLEPMLARNSSWHRARETTTATVTATQTVTAPAVPTQ